MKILDVVIIGGGIAGASAAYFLARAGQRVVVLEREAQPGYHSTGRSAALFSETYGPPEVRALSAASRDFLEHPPAGFSEHPLVVPRGMLMVACESEREALARFVREVRASGAAVDELSAAQVALKVPSLRPEAVVAGALEPDAMDVDVHALHWGYLREMKRLGGVIVTDCEVCRLEPGGARWRVEDGRGRAYEADVVVNAAGAWADRVAQLAGAAPLGLEPRRRTAVTVDVPSGVEVEHWPMVCSISHDYYFKPDAGRLLLSPADETPVEPQDVQPEDLDVAIAVDRFMTATTIAVRRPVSTWAGLRNFFVDGVPVSGYAAEVPGFYWLAGQGGYGIQTSPAMGRLAASLIIGAGVPDDMQAAGIDAAALAPDRVGLARG
jgi:D-arginine dehydrogenase